MDVREVGDVEEVVRHPRRRRAPHLDRRVDPPERRIVLPPHRRDVAGRLADAHPHEPVALLAAERGEVGAGRRGHALARRRDADAAPVRLVRPAVVRADEAAVVDLALGERCLAVGTPVGEGGEAPVARPPDGELDPEHLGADRCRRPRRPPGRPRTSGSSAPRWRSAHRSLWDSYHVDEPNSQGDPDLVVRAGTVMTMNARARRARRRRRSSSRGRRSPSSRRTPTWRAATRRCGCSGGPDALATPGYVNAHQHLTGDRLVRSCIPDDIGSDESIFGWAVPVHAAHSADDDELSATLSLVEAVGNGITTTIEAGTVKHPDRVAAAFAAVGVRGTIGRWGWDVGDGPLAAPAGDVLAAAEALARPVSARRNGRGVGHAGRARPDERRARHRRERPGPPAGERGSRSTSRPTAATASRTSPARAPRRWSTSTASACSGRTSSSPTPCTSTTTS